MQARIVLVALSILCACERTGQIPSRLTPGTTTTVSDSDELHLEPHVRIDGHAEVLVSVSWIGIDRNDGIAVMQQQDRAFRFYNRDGRFLGVVGNKGGGPGEFELLGRSGWLADSLWAMDTELDRINLYSPDRTFVRTVFWPRSLQSSDSTETGRPRWAMVLPWALFTDGTFLIAGVPVAPVGGSNSTTTLMHVTADGRILDIVARRPSNDGSTTVVDGTPGDGAIYRSALVPFYPPPHFEVSSDGKRVVTIVTPVDGAQLGTFRVTLQSFSGDTVFSRGYPFDAVPIPGSVVDSALADRIARARSAGQRRVYRESRDRVPKFYPPVAGVFVGNDQRVWISLRRTSSGRPWLVLAADGTPMEMWWFRGTCT